MKKLIKNNSEFEFIVTLINESRNRAYQKVNEELVLLYFKVGKIVSEKVTEGSWGDGTVNELAAFIEKAYPEMKGFNRRGLYRMKQFYEVYSSPDFVSPIAIQLKTYFDSENQFEKVSALPTQIISSKSKSKKVSAVPTQLENSENQLVRQLLCKITWTNHLEILSKTKSSE
ncbi:MAG: hypothetical protein KA954_05075 [Chitinophagales bacterium]|nr:hypothetical protein [Chitinophagales bacterium]MBP8753943.1 hypothetical protein [Chitinophagales bacterium]MBP9189924.1 hypothetical protein [Chitinophagales bacterium]MBP9548464.1 hypothetical protein [Chitinophagales bacterium]MBP9705205.1 hypothetical protein [Chitinophagales bacterium]